MQRWVLYAFISMFFAGLTAAVGKQGLAGISAELGLTIRTLFVCFFVLIFASMFISPSEIRYVQKSNLVWLGASALAAALSWIFYYKALKMGDVATVALIDKGSVIIAIFLAWLLLKEAVSLRLALGTALIMTGLFVIARK